MDIDTIVSSVTGRIKLLEDAIEKIVQGIHAGAQDVTGTGEAGLHTLAKEAQQAVDASRAQGGTTPGAPAPAGTDTSAAPPQAPPQP